MTAPPGQSPPWRRPGWPTTILVALILGVVAAAHSPLVAVDEIEVLGASRADVGLLVEGAGLGAGALLLWVNTGAIEDAVLADPWVAGVRVDRIWPNRVVVEVLEHQAVVWIEGVQSWMLVSRDGTVLETSPLPGAGLLVAALAFPDRQPGELPLDPAWREVVDMALVLSDDLGATLRLEMRGAEVWTSASGFEVRLGNPIDLADKGRTLRAMLAEEIPRGAIIDVSSPQRPAIVPVESQGVVEVPTSEG